MKKFLKFVIFVTFFVPFSWTIYVPEHTRDNIKFQQEDYVAEEQTITKNKLLLRGMQHSINNKLFKLDNNDGDGNDVKHHDGQERLFTTHQAKINAHQLLLTPTQQKSYDMDDDVDFSEKNHTNKIYEKLEAQPTSSAKHNDNEVLNEVVEENEYHHTLQHSRQRRQLSDFLIAPNTRWCGRGNTANGTYNHLGGASMADKCCRTHDHCKIFIPAMSNRFELFNYRPYTLSHCNCDRRFRTCLKMANDEDANTIGKLFFNLVQTQCFVLTKEVICQQRANDGTCHREHTKQKAYWRNNKKY